MRRILNLAVVLSLSLLLSPDLHGQNRDVQTVAEKSQFQKTSRHSELLRDINHWSQLGHVDRIDFGKTNEGRSLTAAVVANPPLQGEAPKSTDKRLVVLLLGNIHGGEVAGKEALLIMLRELAENPGHPWLKSMIVVFVPNYNGDGNERIGPGKDHRPGQVGPKDGMGWRQNAQGLDLNRDFLKLDAPETRSLVGFINKWDPHVFIDAHTTNGSKHRYQLTYDVPHNPASPKLIREFLRKKVLPSVTKTLEKKGLSTFYYGNFNKKHDRWTTFGYEGRYSTEYMGLRGRIAILSEAYSYASYKTRILASKSFVSECLNYFGKNAVEVRRLTSTARKEIATTNAAVPLSAKLAPFEKKVLIKGFSQGEKKADKDYEATFWGRFKATKKAQRPYAYLIPDHLTRVARRLRLHGVTLERLKSSQELKVEVARLRTLKRGRPFQNHSMMKATVAWKTMTRTVKKGTYIARAGQPLGQLIVTLLEPESSDGFLTWNFFDHCISQGQEFPVWKLMTEESLQSSRVSRVRAKRQLDLDQIYGPKRVNFWGQFGRSRWVSETEYSQSVAGRTVSVKAETGAKRRLQQRGPKLESFLKLPGFSEAEARAALRSRRRTHGDGKAWLFEYANDLYYLNGTEGKARRLTHSEAKEQYSSFSPDGRLIAFIRDFNLYVLSVESGQEWALTTKGHGKLLHGQLDWVYQEELYGRGRFKAYWWSPKSTHISYLRLDESPVKDYTVTDHIPVRGRLEVTSYPKAGDPLPRVSLGVVKAVGGATKWIEKPKARGLERLIGKVSWSPDGGRVIYQILNRLQNHLDLRAADCHTARSWSLIEEKSKAWVEIHGDPIWLKNGDFLWQSDRSGHRHLYLYNSRTKKLKAITKGPWNARRVHGLDPKEEWIYFSGTKDSAVESHGYRVKINGKGLKRLTALGQSHSLKFNSSKTHFIASSSSAHTPPRLNLFKSSGHFVRSLAPNYENVLDAYAIRKPEFMKVPTKDGTMLNAMLIKPPHFNPKKKYPVLCYVYSGPGAPSVWNRWGGSRTLWHQMLAQEGYCVWICDNRSANPTGIKNTWPIYRDMGSKELADIEDGLKYLGKQGFVDMKRIGIWGWSYGGYMTSYALTHSKMFKMGIAGAPVTDWRNYDAIYTERYMGLPQENEAGYRSSSVVKAARNLSGSLLLIHGSIDDNVHLSNTLQLAEALQKAGKHFEMMVYPRNRHGISRPGQSRHLRELMTRFIRKNL